MQPDELESLIASIDTLTERREALLERTMIRYGYDRETSEKLYGVALTQRKAASTRCK